MNEEHKTEVTLKFLFFKQMRGREGWQSLHVKCNMEGDKH